MKKTYLLVELFTGYDNELNINKINEFNSVEVFSSLEKAKNRLVNLSKKTSDYYKFIISNDGLSAIQTEDSIFFNNGEFLDKDGNQYTYDTLLEASDDFIETEGYIASYYQFIIYVKLLDEKVL